MTVLIVWFWTSRTWPIIFFCGISILRIKIGRCTILNYNTPFTSDSFFRLRRFRTRGATACCVDCTTSHFIIIYFLWWFVCEASWQPLRLKPPSLARADSGIIPHTFSPSPTLFLLVLLLFSGESGDLLPSTAKHLRVRPPGPRLRDPHAHVPYKALISAAAVVLPHRSARSGDQPDVCDRTGSCWSLEDLKWGDRGQMKWFVEESRWSNLGEASREIVRNPRLGLVSCN